MTFAKLMVSPALLLAPLLSLAAPPPGYCEVRVCNKLERFTLDPWKKVKDSFGEICQPTLLGKEDAVVGKKLSSSSRWYQGRFNPTKASVTRVKSVGTCTASAPARPAEAMPAPHAIQIGPKKASESSSASPTPPAAKAPTSASAALGNNSK